MDESCRLAAPDQITAFWVPGELWIRAQGTFPQSCWEGAIHKTGLQVWPPPESSIEECRTSQVCLEVETPYELTASFPMATPPKTITVHTSGEPQTVAVELVPDLAVAASAGKTALGVSPALSLETAFEAAVRRLPEGDPPNAGRSFNARIMYQDGGIVGPLVLVYLDQE